MSIASTFQATGKPVAHHPLSHLARWVTHHSRLVLGLWLLLIVASAPLAVTVNGVLSGAGWDAQGSESAKVRDELRTAFPDFPAEAAIVVFHQSASVATDSVTYRSFLAELGTATHATVVFDPLTLTNPSGFISEDGQTVLIPMKLLGTKDAELPESAGNLITFVDGIKLPSGVEVGVTGEWPVWSDFNQSNEEALHLAELLSGVPSLILLYVAFGVALAAGLPLLLAVAGIAFGFGALYLIGSAIPISVWAMNFSMMIGLAVGIDYTLFIVSRYREERERGKSAEDAIEIAMSTAGFAVVLSSISLVFSLAVVMLVPVMVFRSMALGMMLSVTAVMVAALTLLPVVIVKLGDRILVKRQSRARQEAEPHVWDRWTGLALQRPKLGLIAGSALLLAVALPMFGMRLGMPDARVVETGRSSRTGYDLLVAAFGPGAAAPIYITVDQNQADAVVNDAMQFEQVAQAMIASDANAADRVIVQVTPKAGTSENATMDLVANLRDDFAMTAPSALVGGPASQSYDLTQALMRSAPIGIAIIMLGAFLLLLVIFRSVAIAIVSIVLNLLSVGAAFGFATLVFEKGYGASLIGIEPQGFVDAWAPIFFFALLFGLSMDYQLFLLASIRERYERTGNARQAVSEGIKITSKPITNAALIMIVVFIAFGVTGPIPPTELGITLAFAVLVDATVVRMILTPAFLSLLGDRAWWLPTWLDRILPRINFSH